MTPTEYFEIHIYADPDQISRIFQQKKERRNIYVLKPDDRLKDSAGEGVEPLVQLYADLWQLSPPANRFLEELKQELRSKVRIGAIPQK